LRGLSFDTPRRPTLSAIGPGLYFDRPRFRKTSHQIFARNVLIYPLPKKNEETGRLLIQIRVGRFLRRQWRCGFPSRRPFVMARVERRYGALPPDHRFFHGGELIGHPAFWAWFRRAVFAFIFYPFSFFSWDSKSRSIPEPYLPYVQSSLH